MRPTRHLISALISALMVTLPLTAPAIAQEEPVNLICNLTVLCPDTSPCRDWDQQITITEGDAGWSVVWNDDLPSDYSLIADFGPAEDAAQQVRVRSLLFLNPRAQSTQMVTFDSIGRVVVTGHQPQAGPQLVSGVGQCEQAE